MMFQWGTCSRCRLRHRLSRGIILAALMLLCAGVPARAQANGPTYILQAGDTLSALALRFGTSVEAIVSANHISDPALVFAGTELVIPGFEAFTGKLVTEPVQLGESLHSLSVRYGISEEALIRLNRLVNVERLYPDQPFVTIASSEASGDASRATGVLARSGEGLLAVSAAAGLNPWAVAGLNHFTNSPWILPGEVIYVPGGNSSPSALPSLIDTLKVDPDVAVQGWTQEVYVKTTAPVLVRGSLGTANLNFFATGESEWVALQGVYAMAEPGLLDLEIRVLSPNDGQMLFGFRQPLQLVSGDYGFDPVLTVPTQTIDPAYTGPENELLTAVFSKVSMERLWEGAFRFPSSNTEAFASYFGSRRNYNDTGYTAYHTGLDFFGALGDPIYAAARGRVVLAEELTVRGNTTVIDHGWGVYTAYLHQSEFKVKVGDMVEAGDLIGLVGATGRVTGSHLHWEVQVGGVPVDPLEWVQREFP
jgi:murein DD-endopeptidase MepM/ murein hydrolase activator NlpD